jgi:hypothetical protein
VKVGDVVDAVDGVKVGSDCTVPQPTATVTLSRQPPNAEQLHVLTIVAARVAREWQEEREDTASTSSEEPLFELIHGLPGTGKSRVIAWLRELFEAVLNWRHNVQFVGLAFQNSMAANIHGLTIHTWSGISWQDITDEFRGKPGEISQLFINCQSLRWMLVDEISMVSAELLAELQKRVAQTVSSGMAPYKKRTDGSVRPFGGINALLFGDWEQLPPVKATALFDRPSAGSSLLAAAGLHMVWSRDRDSLQCVRELTEPMRCSDPWFQDSFLKQARHGALCADNYFFIHGAPTSVVGSMIPGEDAAPRCGYPRCLELQQREWPALFQQGAKPAEMMRMECDVCKTERHARCRVAATSDDPRFQM